MKKFLKILALVLVVALFLGTFVFLYQKSRPAETVYQTLRAERRTLERTTVVTGTVEPRDEVLIKPQISGIIAELYKEAGQQVKRGEVIAKVTVIPEMSQLNSSENRLRLARLNEQQAHTDFEVVMEGEGSTVNLVSRSVARGDSYQAYRSRIVGNVPCAGHSECDAIIADRGRVDASPELVANHGDAALIHEAAIGKIAGEQIMKLRTLGLTEQEAEEKIVEGFLS